MTLDNRTRKEKLRASAYWDKAPTNNAFLYDWVFWETGGLEWFFRT